MSIKKAVKEIAKGAVHGLGYHVMKIKHLEGPKRAQMMRFNRISTAIDVGANRGDYGRELRKNGFKGRIFSFEPVEQCYQLLAKRAKADPQWTTFHNAAGETPGVLEINITSGEAASSSLLLMNSTHLKNAPQVHNVAAQKVEVVLLDDVLAQSLTPDDSVLLKIDTQGYEDRVLRGAGAILPKVRLIECELSFTCLYEGQLLFPDMLKLLDSLGFEPVFFSPVFSALDSGYALQVDGIFARKQSA